MKNELTPQAPSAMATEFNQHGKKIYNVHHADKVTTGDINTTVILNPAERNTPSVSGGLGTNHEYYNLFVLGGEEFSSFEKGHVLVPKDRALTEYMSPDIKDCVDSLSPKAIEMIKSFPAVFCSENNRYGTCDDSQTAYCGYVTGIRIQDNGIKVYYQTLQGLPQKMLNEMQHELGITGTNNFNELNRTHWCIKRIDLVEALTDAGVRLGFF